MMSLNYFRRALHSLLLGLLLRCPNCGEGRTFKTLFKAETVCPVCKVRFERLSGESVGGMYINLGFAELISIGGYFVTDVLFAPPFALQIAFWLSFNIAFVILFYRHSRSIWIAISYLSGGVQTDAEFSAKN